MIILTLPSIQVNDCVIGPGSPTYDNAYWEVTYVRTYIVAGSQPSSSSGITISASGTTTAGAGSSTTGTSNSSSAAMKWYGLSVGVSVSVVLMFAGLIPAVLA